MLDSSRTATSSLFQPCSASTALSSCARMSLLIAVSPDLPVPASSITAVTRTRMASRIRKVVRITVGGLLRRGRGLCAIACVLETQGPGIGLGHVVAAKDLLHEVDHLGAFGRILQS